MVLWEVLNNKKGKPSRFFRRNEGTTDYATIPSVTLSGDFVIEFGVLINNTAYAQLVSGVDSAINIRNDDGSAIELAGVQYNFAPEFVRGVFNHITVSRVGGNITIDIDGIIETRAIPVSDFDIGHLYCYTFPAVNTNSPLIGILANLRIYDNGTLVRDYPLDDNTSDLREKVSGQNGTVINGTAGQWGLFREYPLLWKGAGLDVPPWDSVAQELLKA